MNNLSAGTRHFRLNTECTYVPIKTTFRMKRNQMNETYAPPVGKRTSAKENYADTFITHTHTNELPYSIPIHFFFFDFSTVWRSRRFTAYVLMYYHTQLQIQCTRSLQWLLLRTYPLSHRCQINLYYSGKSTGSTWVNIHNFCVWDKQFSFLRHIDEVGSWIQCLIGVDDRKTSQK